MRVKFVLLIVQALSCAVLPGGHLRSFESIKSQLEWETSKYFQRLGDPKKDTTFRIVYAPPTVIRYASTILEGDPSTWIISHNLNWVTFNGTELPQRSSEIVTIADHKSNGLVFLITPDRWIQVNSPESLDALNYVLQDCYTQFQTIEEVPWANYATRLVQLYRPEPVSALLSKKFLQNVNIQNTMQGSEKDEGILNSLVMDPTVVHNNLDSTLTFNVIMGDGSVYRWVVHFKFTGSIDVKKIEILELKPKGTFFYGQSDG